MNLTVNEEVNFSSNNGVVGSVIDKSWHLLAGKSLGIASTITAQARVSFVG